MSNSGAPGARVFSSHVWGMLRGRVFHGPVWLVTHYVSAGCDERGGGVEPPNPLRAVDSAFAQIPQKRQRRSSEVQKKGTSPAAVVRGLTTCLRSCLLEAGKTGYRPIRHTPSIAAPPFASPGFGMMSASRSLLTSRTSRQFPLTGENRRGSILPY